MGREEDVAPSDKVDEDIPAVVADVEDDLDLQDIRSSRPVDV